MTHDHHDRDTVVVERDGSGVGMVLGVIAVIALLVALWWFMLGPGAGTTNDNDVDVEVPRPVRSDRSPERGSGGLSHERA